MKTTGPKHPNEWSVVEANDVAFFAIFFCSLFSLYSIA